MIVRVRLDSAVGTLVATQVVDTIPDTIGGTPVMIVTRTFTVDGATIPPGPHTFFLTVEANTTEGGSTIPLSTGNIMAMPVTKV